ncbi:helix-turn-helix domain-containing protein [Leucobacter aridicollis]|uniref:helix-turn-helix domain-containing protein n=1 Tax=Leucobacter aridicollis TaxID=283878 RepID=UPI002167A3C8|nr:helix-turn-helix domain-containing protein [Leucobacter aridicollis]MCS3426761.1 hypothetical protein [Leucobacter aridicollis]
MTLHDLWVRARGHLPTEALMNRPAHQIDDARVSTLLKEGMSNSAIARELGCNEASVRRAKKRLNRPTGDSFPTDVEAQVELNAATGDGTFTNVKTTEKLTDWTHVFEQFGLDPEEFEIVDDTVTMKAWQQSRRIENGDRDTITLYSYGARFRRKTAPQITESDLAEFRERINGWSLGKPADPLDGVPVASALNLADMQLHKRDGGGLKPTLARLDRALNKYGESIEQARARGLNVNEIVLANNGDPFEGIAGNYANQAHTVEGGLRAQMNTVLNVWLMFARELFPMFEKRQFVSVLCNHTQFGRQGGAKDSFTGDEDNGSAFLAETLQRILHATPAFEDVQFTIPRDEMNVYTTAAGVPIGFNHGHKIPKSDATGFESWLNGQVRADRRACDVRLWITAHRHNLQMFDLGNTSVLQCPSCDGGSKWLTDTTGKHSNAGVVSILVGEHHRLGWSDLTFL